MLPIIARQLFSILANDSSLANLFVIKLEKILPPKSLIMSSEIILLLRLINRTAVLLGDKLRLRASFHNSTSVKSLNLFPLIDKLQRRELTLYFLSISASKSSPSLQNSLWLIVLISHFIIENLPLILSMLLSPVCIFS